MADDERLICAPARAGRRGPRRALRGRVLRRSRRRRSPCATTAAVHGYLNRCAHVAMELDWQEGEFFDRRARFDLLDARRRCTRPRSGRCLGGPCNGTPLVKLQARGARRPVYFIGFRR